MYVVHRVSRLRRRHQVNQGRLNRLMGPFEFEPVKSMAELHATLFVNLTMSSGIPLLIWLAFTFLTVRGGQEGVGRTAEACRRPCRSASLPDPE